MAGRRPLILITSSHTTYLGEDAFRLSENYADAVIRAGGLPVAMPLTTQLDTYDELLDRADGLLLSGGAGLDPACYRAALGWDAPRADAAERLVGETTPVREAAELRLLARAEERRMPVLGICRGVQLMNVAHGGTLYHDLATQHAPDAGHLGLVHNEHMDGCISHAVEVEPASLLAQVCGGTRLEVNSLHHQAVRDVAPGFAVNAVATDGVVEGLELPDYPFMVGVQWHPEYLVVEEPMARLFAAFVDACASYRAKR